jgi:hypothetical protein
MAAICPSLIAAPNQPFCCNPRLFHTFLVQKSHFWDANFIATHEARRVYCLQEIAVLLICW